MAAGARERVVRGGTDRILPWETVGHLFAQGTSDHVNDPVRSAIATLLAGGHLTEAAAEAALGAILDGEASPVLISALLVAMRVRGEAAAELAGFVRAMRARAIPVVAPDGTVDTCGTGGDAGGTFNISTATAIVTAAAGVPVAKHGNRAVSSRSGSSDVMAALGIAVETTPAAAEEALRSDGFAYLHAPDFHPGMRHPGPVRRELGVRTAFNLCGPLASPARVRRQLVGVADPAAAGEVAEALRLLGTERAFVVFGDGIDELPLDGSGTILDIRPDRVERRSAEPLAVGLDRAPTSALAGGTPDENAARIVAILDGAETGPARDVVALNAGAALVVAGRAADLADGVATALATIASGAARARLERLRTRAGQGATA